MVRLGKAIGDLLLSVKWNWTSFAHRLIAIAAVRIVTADFRVNKLIWLLINVKAVVIAVFPLVNYSTEA